MISSSAVGVEGLDRWDFLLDVDSILFRLFLLFSGLSGTVFSGTCGTGGIVCSSVGHRGLALEEVPGDAENILVRLFDLFKGLSDAVGGGFHAGKRPLIPSADIVPRFSLKKPRYQPGGQ